MNVIVEAFAFDEKKKGGVNLDGARGSYERYLQCACVSLASFKQNNPVDEVIFATNREIPESYRSLFADKGVVSEVIPFDDFVYPDDIQWGLAYYKLCALKKIVGSGKYDNVVLCDTDVWCQKPLRSFWNEVAGGGIFMVDLHSSVDSKDRQSMMVDASALYGRSFGNATCWGGEVVAGKASELVEFLRHVSETYRMTLEKKIFSSRGDEFLIFASQGMEPRICPANAYACRLWTGRYFTPYRHEELTLLHLPAEKDHAFDKAFKRLKDRGVLPSNGEFVKWCGLVSSKGRFRSCGLPSAVGRSLKVNLPE